jgi:hypothetical protein
LTKNIKGRMFYFGTDKDTALAEYTRLPRIARSRSCTAPTAEAAERLTVKSICQAFLTAVPVHSN